MRLSNVLVSTVLSLLFVSVFFSLCWAGESEPGRLIEERENPSRMVSKVEPFLQERWARQSLDQEDGSSYLPDSNATYVTSILWTNVQNVQVVGHYAYCVFGNGLVILDVSDLANPSFVSRVYLQGGGEGIFVKENYVYLADGDAGLVIIDVSDPAHPESVGSYNTSGYAYGVFVQDTLAYVGDAYSGLQIIRVSDPVHPNLAGSYNTPGSAYGVFVKDTLAYVADGGSGLQVFG